MTNSLIEAQEYKKKAIDWLSQHYEFLDKEWVELVKLENPTAVEKERAAYLEGHRGGICIALRFFRGMNMLNQSTHPENVSKKEENFDR